MKKAISEIEQIEISRKILQGIFIQKLLTDEFKVTRVSQYTISVLIFDKYMFSFWIASNAENFRGYNLSEETNFMNLDLYQHEKEILYPKMREYYIDNTKNPEEIAKRRAEFEKLKLEIENTGL